MAARKTTSKSRSKKVIVTRQRATLAAKKARDRDETRVSTKTSAWEKGGKQWARVLGHFGASA
jgi:hypothetical protein